MTCCESCGSQEVVKQGNELHCNECGYTRDYSKLKYRKDFKAGLEP